MSQPLIPPQQMAEPLLDVQEMQLWLEKVVSWGQADRPDKQKDTCLHLIRLRGFLQQLLTHIDNTSSTTETMKRLPFLGQFLGRLCWNPYVTADDTSRRLLFQCLWGLYSEHPINGVERKANQWIQKVLCQLATEDDTAAQTLLKHIGVPPTQYHRKVIRKTVALVQETIGKSCSLLGDINQRCSCDSILATSEACVSLVMCAEAAPLIGALLQRPVTCPRAVLSEDFLVALSSAYSSHCLSLEEQAVVSLWYHSLSSLEETVLSLLESVLTNTRSTLQSLEQQVAQSLLPKACAQHCSIFLVVNDIFRSILKQLERNEVVRSLIQTFTSHFLRELTLLQPQMSVALKAFFPQSPQNLLVPLLTRPSEMPQESWRHHLNWLSGSLQRLSEEEEEGDNSSTGVHYKVFEAWFLLVQCAHWVQAAVQLLVTAGSKDCGPLLRLLTFYYHPTNRGHHRALQLVRAKEAWDHLHNFFLVLSCPPPVDRLQSLVALLSPQPQQTSLAPLLILDLLVNFAVFSQLSLSGSTEILQTVVDRSGLVSEAVCVLNSLEFRLNEGGSLSSNANRVHLRIKAFQNTLTRMHAVQSPAESQAHTCPL
ncbi:hypothetical protein PAMA_018223 [Pampus argenteus]